MDLCRAACPAPAPDPHSPYRRVLWLVLGLNATMFVVEGVAGLIAGSLSLQADALDFLGDAATYAITLFVLERSIHWRASAALLKGGAMTLFGLGVVGSGVYRMMALTLPAAGLMGSVGVLALAANLLCALLLFRHRAGDSNRRSVWLCTRNDAIANLAVLGAAAGVAVTGSGWPDLAVGGLIAALALSAGFQVMRQAGTELRAAAAQAS